MGAEQSESNDTDLPKLSVPTSSGWASSNATLSRGRSPTSPTSRLPSFQTFSSSNKPSYAVKTPYATPTTFSSSTFPEEQKNSVTTLEINNDVTNKYISSRIALIAAQFWSTNIDTKSHEEQLEIAVAIYLTMMVSNQSMKSVLKHNLKQKDKIEKMAIRFMDMMGWLLRSLLRSDINLYESLINLGRLHTKMGIEPSHFDPMLNSIHDTFSYYFPIKYKVKVKYSIDNIFRVAAHIMTGKSSSISNAFMIEEDCFKSLNHCLKSDVGREYLYNYLTQTWCDEIVIFLQLMAKFKQQTTDKGRFIIARDIIVTSINSKSNVPINISHQSRADTLFKMKEFETKFALKEENFKFPSDFFEMVDMEIYKLIIDNHWVKLVHSLKSMNRVRATSIIV